MRASRLALATLAAVLTTFGLSGTGVAKGDPAILCAAVKVKAAGATASAMLACHAKAAQKGLAVDPDCLAGAADKLATAFGKAEATAKKAGAVCPTEHDAGPVLDEIEAAVHGVVAALRPQAGASKCAAKKLAQVGKHAQKLLAAHAGNRVKPDAAKTADKLAKAEAVLLALFAKLDDKGKDCHTTGDAADMSAAVQGLIVTQACDDGNRCTTDGIAGLVCQHQPVACAQHFACDFRTGTCEVANCCLMSSGPAICVVEIPEAQIPTSQAFCQGVDAAQPSLTLINSGPQCVGWRAAGADDCF